MDPMLMLTAVDSSCSYTAILLHQHVHSCNLFLSDDRHLSRSWAIAVDTRPPRNSTHHLNTVLRFRHASPYMSFIRRKMSLGDAPSLHRIE
jgi:hypothetical protein